MGVVLDRHGKWQARAVAAGVARRRIGQELAAVDEPVGAGFLRPPAPAADASHLVEGRPAGKRVVGRVHDDQAAASLHVGFELRLELGRPPLVRRVVVHHDRAIALEIGAEVLQFAGRGRRRDDVHLEQAGLIERLFQQRRREPPLVVGAAALAVEQHHPHARRRAGQPGHESHDQDEHSPACTERHRRILPGTRSGPAVLETSTSQPRRAQLPGAAKP